jgi:ABC-2 type transport system permease protein
LKSIIELAKVELKLFFREPISMVFIFALPLILYPILGAVFSNISHPDLFRGFGAMDFYTPAYIGLVLAANGLIQLPVHLAGYRQRGVLRRFRASSLSAGAIFGSQVIVSAVIAVIGAALLLTMGVAGYDVQMPQSPALVVGAFLVSLLCFIAIGVLLGALMPTPQAAQGGGLVLYIIMMLLGGAGPPAELLSEELRTVGDFTPLKHVVILIQDPWLGLGWNNTEFIIILAVTAVAALLAVRFFRWE